MKINIPIYIFLILLISSFSSLAQDIKKNEKTNDETVKVSEEIEIVRPYKPVLAEAVKLRRSPDLEKNKIYKTDQKYALYDNKLEINSDIQKLQAQQLAAIKAIQLSNNYAKIGLGNLGTLMADVYIAMGKDPALQTGLFFNHINQQGKLAKQNENKQEFGAFIRGIGENQTFNAKLNFQRHGLNYYGLNPDTSFVPSPDKQIYNFIELEGEAISKFTPDPDAFSYAAKINSYLFNDHYKAKEKTLTFTGYLNKRIKSFNLGVASSIELGNTKDINVTANNSLFRLNPYIKIQKSGLKIIAGLNLANEFGSRSRSWIFPAITADFTLIDDFLQIFGELKGDINRFTLKDLSDENPFLNQNITIKNSVEKINISGGIKGTGGPGFGYKAKIYQKEITDMPYFVNNYNNYNKFDVLYDFGTTRILGLEGELSVQVSDNLKWTGKLNLEDYKAGKEKETYYKPQMRLSSNFTFVYNKKVSFEANIRLQDDSKAKIFISNPLNPDGTYPPIPDFSKEKLVNVKGFVDLGLGMNYKVNSQFGVFAKVNNSLNSNYSKFLYYRLNGINIFGGLSYSF